MKQALTLLTLILILAFAACNNKKAPPAETKEVPELQQYTCAMHPEIVRNQPGDCPICGMTLIKKIVAGKKITTVALEELLKPTNEFVVSNIPVTVLQKRTENIAIEALGNIAYDTRQVANISSRVSGRIEKLYMRYRYQKIHKGDKVLDVYSPELVTAQQQLLFVLKNDGTNFSLIDAAKQKLLILGMSEIQLKQIIASGEPSLTVTIYSNYSGHIHESANGVNMLKDAAGMKDLSKITEELSLKEGMYVQKETPIFSVYNPSYAWAIINIFGENQALVKVGDMVTVMPETDPQKKFQATISFIEPFFRKDSKTVTARINFNNTQLQIPIGSQVRASVIGSSKEAFWLPETAVISLGLARIVFEKITGGFKAHKIVTGITHQNQIQVLSGLLEKDSVAENAQYLMDSESFIKVKNE